MITDSSTNYLYVPNPETVTYQVKLGEGSYADPVTVQYAKRFNVHKDEFPLEKDPLVWHLWTAQLAANTEHDADIVPKRGDLIIAADYTWIIQQVQLQSYGQKYRCIAYRKLT